MKILVTGSTGFLGSALVSYLSTEGHGVIRLVRGSKATGDCQAWWDPNTGAFDTSNLGGIEGVVHLAGESILGRWTARRKARIRDSRIDGTRLLCETLAKLDPRPRALASASAYGYYGDRGGELLREDGGQGSDFLAKVTGQWEAATQPASQSGIRVVNLRFGLILGRSGGILARTRLPFKLGIGGRLGSGKQYVSWISLEDTARGILHALTTESLQGPVNLASPNAVTNAEFTKVLGRALSRPTPFAVPAFALRLVMGELADSVLASARMDPAKLLGSGFVFHHPDLEGALRSELATKSFV